MKARNLHFMTGAIILAMCNSNLPELRFHLGLNPFSLHAVECWFLFLVIHFRKVGVQPRRSLSVEDIGSPNLVRTVGRVVEVFPDGTSQLELKRPPQGSFGFRVSSGNGRPDTGILVLSSKSLE